MIVTRLRGATEAPPSSRGTLCGQAVFEVAPGCAGALTMAGAPILADRHQGEYSEAQVDFLGQTGQAAGYVQDLVEWQLAYKKEPRRGDESVREAVR